MLVKKGVSTRGLRALAGHSFPPPWITMIHGGELPKQLLKKSVVFFFVLLFQFSLWRITPSAADRAYSLRT